jgi:PAS domain S-box-containing protein
MKPLKFIRTLNETEPEMARREYITRNVLFFTFSVTFSFAMISLVFYLFGKMPLDTLLIYSIESIILVVAMFLTEAGFWRVVGIIPPLLMYFPAVNANYIGGVDAPGNFMYALLIMLVAIIYGYRKMWIALVICLTTYLCLAWMISSGYIKPFRTAEVVFVNRVVLTSGFLVGIASLIWLLGRSYRSEVDVRIKAEELLYRKNEELGALNTKLRDSEEKYRNILENIDEAYFELDLRGNIVFFSDPALRISGYSQNELMGMNYRQYASTETAEKLKASFSNIYKTGEKWNLSDFELIRKDKSTCQMEISVNLMSNSAGEAIGFRCIARDITDRKQAEEDKRRLEERLQRAEKMEALGTLAGGVAHDLNNVLGVVIGYSELLLMDEYKSRSIGPSLVNIMNGAQKAAAIVQDMLTLARRGVPGREVLNLNKIIADCQKSPEFEKLFPYHPFIRIETDLEPDLLNVSGSSVHLGKTLFNLVSNAGEAMPKGGILTIKTANRYLDRPIQGYDEVREGDYVVLSVSDTGEGIPAADLKRIFEPFYTKKVMGRSGTGLGLAVVWGTVKDHNGYINVESEEGKGSTFTLYFPVTREDITAEAAAISISEYMGKGESILVVDDVKEQRDLAAEMLRKLNYNVTSASSGEDAVASLREHKIDLIVLDMIMDPGMDGLDTYRRVLEIHPQQKALIVSGFSESDRVITAQDLGAGAYVRKPYVIEKLGLAAKRELDRK